MGHEEAYSLESDRLDELFPIPNHTIDVPVDVSSDSFQRNTSEVTASLSQPGSSSVDPSANSPSPHSRTDPVYAIQRKPANSQSDNVLPHLTFANHDVNHVDKMCLCTHSDHAILRNTPSFSKPNSATLRTSPSITDRALLWTTNPPTESSNSKGQTQSVVKLHLSDSQVQRGVPFPESRIQPETNKSAYQFPLPAVAFCVVPSSVPPFDKSQTVQDETSTGNTLSNGRFQATSHIQTNAQHVGRYDCCSLTGSALNQGTTIDAVLDGGQSRLVPMLLHHTALPSSAVAGFTVPNGVGSQNLTSSHVGGNYRMIDNERDLVRVSTQNADNKACNNHQSKKKPKLRYSKGAAPSKYCHVCGRSSKTVDMATCSNNARGLCRKVVCEKCLMMHQKGSLDVLNETSSTSICMHCRGQCPEGARCHQYKWNNISRRRRDPGSVLFAYNGRLVSQGIAKVSSGRSAYRSVATTSIADNSSKNPK